MASWAKEQEALRRRHTKWTRTFRAEANMSRTKRIMGRYRTASDGNMYFMSSGFGPVFLLVTKFMLVHGLMTSSTRRHANFPPYSVSFTRLLSSQNEFSDFARQAGESALQQVQWLGTRVTEQEEEYRFATADDQQEVTDSEKEKPQKPSSGTAFVGGGIKTLYQQPRLKKGTKEKQVWDALANLENDMQFLDVMAGQRPSLSALEFTLLTSAVLAAASGPLVLGGQITNVLAPSCAAFTAAIGISAEYTGKVAVADGKEVAAATIQCAAEAEGFLANAERAKAVTPLCVGVGATAASLALLVPALIQNLVDVNSNLPLRTEIYLLCPLVSVLAAAVASLALQETKSFAQRAIGVGNRRFARSGLVGRTWLSSTEQIEGKSQTTLEKWKTFSLSVLPAPLIGSIVPGSTATKTIVVAALAAAESAYFLAEAENVVGRATDAVALKARSAAVCDTYANQGARSSAILPFTSALSGLCAAATAAFVELPLLHSLAATGTVYGTALQVLTVAAFPAFSALFAAAASVSKARCLVDAEASVLAASTLALPYEDEEEDPVLRPLRGVRELVQLTFASTIREPLKKSLNVRRLRRGLGVARQWLAMRLRRLFKRGGNGTSRGVENAVTT